MVTLTVSAIEKLKALILEHPEDPVVRIAVRDLDETRIGFSITLEPATRDDDQVQDCDGLTLAFDPGTAPRVQGMTVDYAEPGGFSFRHPAHGDDDPLRIISMN